MRSTTVTVTSSSRRARTPGASLEPGHAAAITVAEEGGEVVSMHLNDDFKSALDGVAPDGVAVAGDGSAT